MPAWHCGGMQVAQVGGSQSQLQAQLQELHSSLSQRDDRLRQLQRSHAAEVARLEGRVRQLEREVAAAAAVPRSPTELPAHQVRDLTQTLATLKCGQACVCNYQLNLMVLSLLRYVAVCRSGPLKPRWTSWSARSWARGQGRA